MELLPGTFKVVTSLPEASSMVLGATTISNSTLNPAPKPASTLTLTLTLT